MNCKPIVGYTTPKCMIKPFFTWISTHPNLTIPVSNKFNSCLFGFLFTNVAFFTMYTVRHNIILTEYIYKKNGLLSVDATHKKV